MKANYFLSLVALVLCTACNPSTPTSDFRSDDRPEYTRQVSLEEVKDLTDRGGVILDVRLKEDYDANPVLIPDALYRDPELMSDWASDLEQIDAPVVVYCVRGKWVSQKVASELDERGHDVYVLDGGIEAWQADGRETVAGQ